MRMRRKPNLEPRMQAVEQWLIKQPADLAGKWREEISSGRPIHLEIGCGKGRFAVETAKNEPDIFFIALELVPDCIVMAMERAARDNVENIRFINGNALGCLEFFAPGEVERIYLNFSDPWPSNRHKHRRLTSEDFLKVYRTVLKPGGAVFQKTDNVGLFDYSLLRFKGDGWELSNVTRDLHSVGGGGVMTEYEERFSSQGVPICRLEARLPIAASAAEEKSE